MKKNKKMTKKIICLLLALITVITLCACGDKTKGPEAETTAPTTTNETPDNTTDTTNDNTTDNINTTDTTETPANTESGETTEITNLPSENTSEENNPEHIAECKKYLESVKVSLCDYSVFDYKNAKELGYVENISDGQSSENACSIVVVIDYGKAENKKHFSPTFDLVISNTANTSDGGAIYTCEDTAWMMSDETIEIYLYRLNCEIPMDKISYSISSKHTDTSVQKQFGNIEGFDKIIRAIEMRNGGWCPIRIMDNRAYMFIESHFANKDLCRTKTENKYFIEKECIFVPLTGGATNTLTSKNFKFRKLENCMDGVGFSVRINHESHHGHNTVKYNVSLGVCATITATADMQAVIEGYLGGEHQKYEKEYNDIVKSLDECYGEVVFLANKGTDVYKEVCPLVFS